MMSTMLYYSTNKKAPVATLREAVTKGLAPDGGLYMPERIPMLDDDFLGRLPDMGLHEISMKIAAKFLEGDIPLDELHSMICETLNFPVPLKLIDNSFYALELFHGPTMAFKDVGARFMARLLGYYTNRSQQELNILVATSGDTGSAVANGFYKVPGIHVFVLYPKGLVSTIQEKQFTTLGENITALEVEGTFDDCQAMVKRAFADEELKNKKNISSANSINWARLLPQTFYYFWGYAQLGKGAGELVCAVPSGNFGNLCAGLIAKRMGLPIYRIIAATNRNDIVPQYLKSGVFNPRPSVATIANAMDVGNPSNFARIAELYDNSHVKISNDIEGFVCSENDIRSAIKSVHLAHDYLLDPHGAIAYSAMKSHAIENPDICKKNFFIATAHPAKFGETIESIIQRQIELPSNLARFATGIKQTTEIPATYEALKEFLSNS